MPVLDLPPATTPVDWFSPAVPVVTPPPRADPPVRPPVDLAPTTPLAAVPGPGAAAAPDPERDRRRPGRVLFGLAGACCVVAGTMLLVSPPLPTRADFGDPLPAVGAPAAPAQQAGGAPTTIALRGVAAPVVPVRTEPDGQLGVPDPPTTVGWWTPSALPGGTGGTTVLAGHVDSRLTGLGTFSVLRDLRPGEIITIGDAAGRTLTYSVVARQEYGKAQLPVQDLFASGGPARLVLITCGGEFDPTTRSYADNVVVYAVPVINPATTVTG